MTTLYSLLFLFCFSAFASAGPVSEVLNSNSGKTVGIWIGNTRYKDKPCELNINTFNTNDFWVSIENFYYKNTTGVGPFLDNTSEFTLRNMKINQNKQQVIIDLGESIGWPFSIRKGRLYKLTYDRSLKFTRYELIEGEEKPAVCLFKD